MVVEHWHPHKTLPAGMAPAWHRRKPAVIPNQLSLSVDWTPKKFTRQCGKIELPVHNNDVHFHDLFFTAEYVLHHLKISARYLLLLQLTGPTEGMIYSCTRKRLKKC
jgi:hypothetical protein